MHVIQLHASIKHLRLSGIWLGVAPRMDTEKICVYKRLDYMLKYDNHSRLSRIYTLIMNKISF